MKNKEVSIGLCGAIVGILIGAGSVAYAQELAASLEASALQGSLVAYRNTGLEEAYLKRRAQREVDTVPVEAVEAVHSAAPMTDQERNACIVKVNLAEELRGIILPLIPDRPIDQLVRHAMNQAFDAYIIDCQSVRDAVLEEQQRQEAIPVYEPPVEHVPNFDHCEGFSGVRMTRCIDDERKGNPWYRGGAQ